MAMGDTLGPIFDVAFFFQTKWKHDNVRGGQALLEIFTSLSYHCEM